jgi:hypothetical protein
MSDARQPGRRLVAEGGQLHTRPPSRRHPLMPESPRRPEIQEEIRQGVRNSKGKVRGSPTGGIPGF